MHKKIAFCFLVYYRINLTDVWQEFFNNIDTNLYNIYIHYKVERPMGYFEPYKLENCIETKYENETIPLAYNILFRKAYEDPENFKFIILSDSCIPMKSFKYIYNHLTKDDKGYFYECKKSDCFPVCDTLIEYIEPEHISKSFNWFIINRNLVEALCFDKDNILTSYYSSVYAPAEFFYLTFIRKLNLENNIICFQGEPTHAPTFANWSSVDYKYPNTKEGLKEYTTISKNELLYLMNSPCLFARKFEAECITSLFKKEYILHITT